jgi:hypothetical protein
MGDTRDGWSKAEVLIGAIGAAGSIAIPIMLFVVGNEIAARQAEGSARQLQADRVERMLGHLASTNADERRLAVSVVRYYGGAQDAFPADLVALLIEVANVDPNEEVAATASVALEKVAQGQGPSADVARTALQKLTPRLNVRGPRDDARVAKASAATRNDVVVMQQQTQSPAEAPAETQLRYFRKEDQAQAQRLADDLEKKGIKANLVDLSAQKQQARPRNFDLVLGPAQAAPDRASPSRQPRTREEPPR